MLFGWSSRTASTYLANWRRAGLVPSLGGRSDVHMNLVRNPIANPEGALRSAKRPPLLGDAWLLAPDDIDLQAAVNDPQMAIALSAFNLSPDDLTPEGYESVYEQSTAAPL